jgi:putative ABC transport system permease protein
MVRKARTLLCILGVTLAATFLVAIGATTMRYTTVIRETNVLFNEQVMVISKDAIVIQAVPIGGGMLPEEYTLERLDSVTGVSHAVPVLLITPIGLGQIIQPIPVNFTIGIPVDDWRSVLGSAIILDRGGHLPSNDTGNEVVVGASLSDQYGLGAGAQFEIDGQSVVVVGILRTSIAILSRSVLMPLQLAQKVYNYPHSVNMVVVTPSEGISEETLSASIEQDLAFAKALTDQQRNDIVEPVLAQVDLWNRGIQATVFAMSLILVMTVITMNVSERRRDFATLDAMGAPLSFTFRVILIEAAIIGLIGAVLGVILGTALALVLASLYTQIPVVLFFSSIFDVVPPVFMLEISGATIGVCCLGALLPAINAARVRIADVLRAEY